MSIDLLNLLISISKCANYDEIITVYSTSIDRCEEIYYNEQD